MHHAGAAHTVKGDLDGDGRSDLVAASYDHVHVYYTSATPGGSSEQVFAAPTGGATSLAVGDFNDDGYGDLAIGAPGYGPSHGAGFEDGAILVYYGSADGIDPGTFTALPGPDNGGGFGERVVSFDYNHDGIDDILGIAGFTAARFRIYPGSATGVAPSRHSRLNVADVYGIAGGDVNGDGRSDLVLGRPDTGKVKRYSDGDVKGQEGTVAVYYGTRHGYSSTAHVIHGVKVGTGYGNLGTDLAVAKVNSDRYADVIAGAPNWGDGSAVVLYGSSHGLEVAHHTTVDPDTAGLPGSGHDADAFGSQIATGDVNGDGYGDAIIAATQDYNGRYGSVYVLYGAHHRISTHGAQRLTPSQLGERGRYQTTYGASLVTLRDGSRYASIAIGAPDYAPSDESLSDGYGTGLVDVFRGSASGATTSGAYRLDNTVDHRYFGEAVAG
jgi:hypothetical protein